MIEVHTAGEEREGVGAEDDLEKRVPAHTSYRPYFLRILPSDEENNIPLAGVDIVVLEEEELVHAVFLERAELDEQADGAG